MRRCTGPAISTRRKTSYCPHAPDFVKQQWFDRIKDMIDRYHPDLVYSDSPLPYPDEFGRKLLAHYYNDTPGVMPGESSRSTTASRIRKGCGSKTSSAA